MSLIAINLHSAIISSVKVFCCLSSLTKIISHEKLKHEYFKG